MAPLVLVTDSTSDIPAAVAEEYGILVARARYAFHEHAFTDGDQAALGLYGRMDGGGEAPAPFGTPETAFKELFQRALNAGQSPVCIVSPFDVNPSFTTALAAMLSIDDVDMKVVNAGVASAGLCSLLVTLSHGIRAGWDRQQLLDAVDELGPQCDSLFVPRNVDWLERSGRLGLVEEKFGELDGALPIVRVGTRIIGVAQADDHASAIAAAAMRAGARLAHGKDVVVTITHAVNEGLAAKALAAVEANWNVTRAITTELSATIGTQLGPGTVGIGIAPAPAPSQ